MIDCRECVKGKLIDRVYAIVGCDDENMPPLHFGYLADDCPYFVRREDKE